MAKANNRIIIESKLRPCIVIRKRGLFHRWADIVEPANSTRSEQRCTVGIVELEDGSVIQAYPREIKFVDDWVSVIHGNL